MATDEQIIDFHRRNRDKLNQPRPVSHVYRFASLAQANSFATEARRNGFPTGRSETTNDYVEVSVDAAHPLIDSSGDPDPAFAAIAAIAQRHAGTRCDWRTEPIRPASGDAILRLIRKARHRRRISRL